MALAFAATDTFGGRGSVLPKGSAHKIFSQRPEFAFGEAAVVRRKGAGNVNAAGAGHAVSAARAADLHFRVYLADNGGKHRVIGVGHKIRRKNGQAVRDHYL